MEKPKKQRKSKKVVDNKLDAKIKNYYLDEEVQAFQEKSHNPNYDVHKIQIPHRMAVIGGSGSGKTNIVINLIRQFNNTFKHIYIYTRCKDEALYEYLEAKIDKSFLTIKEGLTDFNKIDLNKEFKDKENILIIFDDLCLERDQSKIEELYIRGRKLFVSVIYISQSYYKIPKTIRLQCQYIILKKISSTRDLNMILADASLGVDKKELNNIYKYAIHGDITNFLLIDLVVPSEQSFRKCFDQIIDINNFV
jgi:hypothetical protein